MTDRAYVRISLDTAESGSIDKQKAQIAERVPAPVWYVDRSVSGSKVPFAERPAGAKLLAELKKGDRVIFAKIDRAARNTRDLLGLVQTIQGRGAAVVFVDPAIDTTGPFGSFMLTLLAAIAELEAGIIAERRRESLAQFKIEGRHAVGAAPFGLISVANPTGRGLVLRPDPATAPAVRDAVARVLAGESQTAIAEDLGIGRTHLSRLLRNERLAGILGYDADGTPRLDPDMAIFTLPEWDELARFLDGRGVKTWAPSEDLGPALRCGVCGDRLYFQRAANPAHSTYKCRRVHPLHAEEKLPSASVTAGNVERFVEADFLTTFGAVPVVERVEVSHSAARREAVARARVRLDAARRGLDVAGAEEEERAFAAFRSAKAALRDAEALPDEVEVVERETGETFGEVWARSTVGERAALLLRVGGYVVEPGRMPIGEKVHRALDGAPDYLAGQLD